MKVGVVATMRYVKDGVRAARLVMKFSQHLLAGEGASAFAISMSPPGLIACKNLSYGETASRFNTTFWGWWKLPFCRSVTFKVSIVSTFIYLSASWGLAYSLVMLTVVQVSLKVSKKSAKLQEAGVSGINSKTHMKLLLKWMRGRKMLKLICNQVGSSKKFFHIVYPDDPQAEQDTPVTTTTTTEKKKQGVKRRSKQAKCCLTALDFGANLREQNLCVLVFDYVFNCYDLSLV